MMTTLTITLPHTPRCLSPNAKAPLSPRGAMVAGYKKTAAKSRARNIAWGRTYETLNGRRMVPTHYWVIWYYKGARPGRGQLPCPLQGVPGWSLQGHGHRRQDTGLRRD